MNLADAGADVIKIEAPSGDDTRSWGPPFVSGESSYFLSVNRNKWSIAVNVKHPQGLQVVRDLADSSDVFLENFLPGKLDAMGLGYDALSQSNPGLIYGSLSGFGQNGPYANRAGYDVIVSAIGGLMSVTGTQEPAKVGVAITDIVSGLYLTQAVTSALYHREKTGKGQRIDCSLLESQIAVLANVASNYLTAGIEGKRWGTAHESIVPYQAFETRTGHIVVGALNDRQFASLCRCLDMSELADDEKFATNPMRVENREDLLATLSDKLRKKDTEHWLDIFSGSGLAYGPINSMKELFEDEHVKHLKMVERIESHKTIANLDVVRSPINYSETPAAVRMPPPTLSQHCDEILTGVLGYSKEKAAALKREGAVVDRCREV